MAPPVSKLPPEMLTHTLKYLSPDDLRAASTVSQKFYDAAHDAGLTLDRTIWSFEFPPLATFRKIIKHAATRRQPFRLGLSIWLGDVEEADRETSVPKLKRMLASVRNALPYLVTLSVCVPNHLTALVYTQLDKPAPRLRTLSLSHAEMNSVDSVQIPAKLFNGDAPCLRDVRLDIAALLPEWAPVPAWNNVRRVRVSRCRSAEWLAISRFFPAVQDVELTGMGTPLPLRRVDISGLTLRTLTVLQHGRPALYHNNAPPDDAPTAYALRPKIATVEYQGTTLQFDPFLWPDNDCVLHAHVQCLYDADRQPPPLHGDPIPEDDSLLPTGMTVSVVPAEDRLGTWRQTQYIVCDAVVARGVAALRLDPLAALGARLVSLAVAEPLLEQLMQTPLTLDVLHELFVDLTPAPRVPQEQRRPCAHLLMVRQMYVYQHHMLLSAAGGSVQPQAESKLRCPALERVVLFAMTPLTVASDRIASLSRPLQGAAGTRVELVLVGVDVEPEAERPALEELFASVRRDTASPSSLLAYSHPREDDRIWNFEGRMRI